MDPGPAVAAPFAVVPKLRRGSEQPSPPAPVSPLRGAAMGRRPSKKLFRIDSGKVIEETSNTVLTVPRATRTSLTSLAEATHAARPARDTDDADDAIHSLPGDPDAAPAKPDTRASVDATAPTHAGVEPSVLPTSDTSPAPETSLTTDGASPATETAPATEVALATETMPAAETVSTEVEQCPEGAAAVEPPALQPETISNANHRLSPVSYHDATPDSRPLSGADVDQKAKTGYLELRVGGGIFSRRKWLRRHFVLANYSLSYSEHEDGKPESHIELGRNTTAHVDGNVLTITTGQRAYACRATDRAEAKAWETAIREQRSKSKRYRNRQLLEFRVGKENGSLGIQITGGSDSGIPEKTQIFIAEIKPDGAAERQGLLQVGDILIELDDVSLEGMTLSEATTALQRAPSTDITVKVLRKRGSKRGNQSDPEAITATNPEPTPEAVTPAPANDVAPESKSPDIQATAVNGVTELSPIAETEAGTAPAAALSPEEEEAKRIEREERLRRMKEKRLQRKSTQNDEVMAALALIDSLPED